jgi:outer membrane protein assembly factor BamB
VPLSDGRLVALDITSGTPLWERRLGGAPNQLLAKRGRLYVGAHDNFLYCVEAAEGRIAWRWRTGGDVVDAPIADEDRLYFGSYDNVLRALDLDSGAQRWKRSLPLRPLGSPVMASTALLVGGLSPMLRGYAMKDGAAAGEIATGGTLAGPPHAIDVNGLPMVVFVARDVAKGTVMTAVMRSFEPPVLPLTPLPNPTPVSVPTNAPGT